MMKNVIAILLICLCGGHCLFAAERELEVIIVRGADGAEEYGRRFDEQVKLWQEACKKGGATSLVIGTHPKGDTDAEQLKGELAKRSASAAKALWLVFIGHGTIDGREDRFNFRGPDVGSKEIAEWLAPLKQEIVVVQCASASGGWIKALKGKNRIIITATKGPDEIYFTHFGDHMAKAIGGLAEADLDADRQVSLLEAWLFASHQVTDFYEKEGRIATEHAVLEDNGDGAATRSEVFHGAEPANAPKGSTPDGDRARQLALVLSEDEQKLSPEARTQRDLLEGRLRLLKQKRAEMEEGAFFTELEALLRELAAVYRAPNTPQ